MFLVYLKVQTTEELVRWIDYGNSNKTIGETAMNMKSSRAHTIVKIVIDQLRKKNDRQVQQTAELNLVDLAGSERVGKSDLKNDQIGEGSSINLALLALGNVIEAIAESQKETTKRKIHIPYRESNLTKLLSNALGGNSKTIMLATISLVLFSKNKSNDGFKFLNLEKEIIGRRKLWGNLVYT